MRTTLCLLVAAAVANRHAEQPHLDVFQGAAEFVRLDEKLTVHMVHHTHDDVGWLKTVDEYFSGTDKNVQRAQVKLIIDSMIEELLKDENKRFSYVEMKFFQMWWRTQSEDMKKQVRKLVQSGRLELLNAGWSMHDEACTHYEDMITNMQQGHKFVLEEFGVKPRVGWQIDPFGHSAANARLYAEMGFDAIFFGRPDFQDKQQRLENKEMEFLWRPMWDNLGQSAQIFGHCLYNEYDAPTGFDFDSLSTDPPFIVDEQLDTYNAPERSKLFYDWVVHQHEHYRSNDIILTMGEDFRFSNAHKYFISSDNLINYWNTELYEKTNIWLQYSTPSMYVDAVNQQEIDWPVKYDDFFPYADHEAAYWTGYFSSRANAKKFFRDGQHTYHASNKLFSSLALDPTTTDEQIQQIQSANDQMKDALSIVQHHDAVTGTAKQHVADDYNTQIANAREHQNQVYADLIDGLAQRAGIKSQDWQWCTRTNGTVSDCEFSTPFADTVVVATHNPSEQDISNVWLKVPHGHFQVQAQQSFTHDWYDVPASVFCNEQSVEFQPDKTETDCTMYVEQQVKAGQIGFIKLVEDPQADLAACDEPSVHEISSGAFKLSLFGIENDIAQFKFSDILKDEEHNLGVSLRWYESFAERNQQRSGAYVFRPRENQYASEIYSVPTEVVTKRCTGFERMTIKFESQSDVQGSALVHIFIQSLPVPMIRTQVRLDGLPNTLAHGHEVTVNFHSDVENNQVFYTDSNGLELQERMLNYRPDYEVDIMKGGLNVTANFYPINSAITLEDAATDLKMAVVNDRAQAGSVLETGRVELMMNRRIFKDDDRGVNQPLNECNAKQVGITVSGEYAIQLTTGKLQHRAIQKMFDQPQQQFFAFGSNFVASHTASMLTEAGLGICYEHQLTAAMKLELFAEARDKLTIRLENLDDEGQISEVDLEGIAYCLVNQINPSFGGTLQIQELSLNANMKYEDMVSAKLAWKAIGESYPQKIAVNNDYTAVEMGPQRLRVFSVEYISNQTFLQ